MFPSVEETELDLAELGSEMSERKQELMKQMGVSGSRSRSKTTRRTKSRSTSGRKSSRGKRARA
jgi:hypothetical protein